MIIYKLGARGFESHCSHLESFAYPKVSHKGSKGGGTVWHIWFLILLGTVFCIELIDLIPTSFFKEVVIVLLKMHATGEILLKLFQKLDTFFFWYVLSIQGRDRKGENEGKWYTYFFASGGRRGWRYDRMVGNFENLSMSPPTPCPLFLVKPLCPYTKACITHIVFVSESVQRIIQRKSASGFRTLTPVLFDKKVSFFPKIVLF